MESIEAIPWNEHTILNSWAVNNSPRVANALCSVPCILKWTTFQSELEDMVHVSFKWKGDGDGADGEMKWWLFDVARNKKSNLFLDKFLLLSKELRSGWIQFPLPLCVHDSSYAVDTTVQCACALPRINFWWKPSHTHTAGCVCKWICRKNENLFNFWESAHELRVATPTTDLAIVAKFIGSTLSAKRI